MSKQDLIDFVEKVSLDPKYQNEAEMLILKERFHLFQENEIEENLIWNVLDELRNICLDTDIEGGYMPHRGDAKELIRIVKLYLDP